MQHVILLASVIGHRATPKKCGAVRDKLFSASILRHDAVRRSVAPAMIMMINSKALRSAAFGGAVALCSHTGEVIDLTSFISGKFILYKYPLLN